MRWVYRNCQFSSMLKQLLFFFFKYLRTKTNIPCFLLLDLSNHDSSFPFFLLVLQGNIRNLETLKNSLSTKTHQSIYTTKITTFRKLDVSHPAICTHQGIWKYTVWCRSVEHIARKNEIRNFNSIQNLIFIFIKKSIYIPLRFVWTIHNTFFLYKYHFENFIIFLSYESLEFLCAHISDVIDNS